MLGDAEVEDGTNVCSQSARINRHEAGEEAAQTSKEWRSTVAPQTPSPRVLRKSRRLLCSTSPCRGG